MRCHQAYRQISVKTSLFTFREPLSREGLRFSSVSACRPGISVAAMLPLKDQRSSL
jgi:hypothetical protein